MIVLNYDSIKNIPGNKGVYYNESKLIYLESVNNKVNDGPFEKLYMIKSSTGNYLPFYLLWDGEEFVSTKTTFEDAERNKRYAHNIACGDTDAKKEAKNWLKKNNL